MLTSIFGVSVSSFLGGLRTLKSSEFYSGTGWLSLRDDERLDYTFLNWRKAFECEMDCFSGSSSISPEYIELAETPGRPRVFARIEMGLLCAFKLF